MSFTKAGRAGLVAGLAMIPALAFGAVANAEPVDYNHPHPPGQHCDRPGNHYGDPDCDPGHNPGHGHGHHPGHGHGNPGHDHGNPGHGGHHGGHR